MYYVQSNKTSIIINQNTLIVEMNEKGSSQGDIPQYRKLIIVVEMSIHFMIFTKLKKNKRQLVQ